MEKLRNLSPSTIDSLREGKHIDPMVPGLCVIVNGGGRRTWQFRRRVARSGAIVSLKLGSFPAHSIASARQWAEKLNEAIERGEDPRVQMRIERARGLTVSDAHLLYMDAMRRGDRKKLKPRTLYDKEVIFDRDIKPRLGSRVLGELTENDCWDAVYDKAKGSKVRANKMAGELSCFLRWASGREGRMAGLQLTTHPAPTLNSNWFSTGPQANTRFLNEEEIGWFFQALATERLAYRRGLILLLLTAARRSELFGASAAEVKDGVWTLPAERSKNGIENVVALGSWGQSLAKTDGDWLFPSPRKKGPQLHGWFKVRDSVHSKMEKLAEREIPSWHFHDLRRTFRSHARRVGIDREIAELMLNHKRKGIEGIYDRNQELELRSAGFSAWEYFLMNIATSAKVLDDLCPP